MTMQKQITFWLVGFVAVGIMLYLLSGILLPFAAGLILAYLLDPIVEKLVDAGIGRVLATSLILGSFALIFTTVLVLILPLIAHQLSDFIASIPDILTRIQALIHDKGAPLLQKIGGFKSLEDLKGSWSTFAGQGAGWLGGALKSLLSGGQAVAGIMSLLVITPVVTFYMLCDWDRMIKTIDECLPRAHVETIRSLMREIDSTMGGFLRGQALVCLFLGSFYAIGLALMGVKSGVLIGVMTGAMSFIPYVGSITGLIIGTSVAIAQFWPDAVWPIAVLVLFGVGQFIEGNFLTPKLVGASVGLHPVWLLFALLAFGSLFGFLGLLLAVPIAAIIGVLTRFFLKQYLNSPLYGADKKLKKPIVNKLQ